MKVIAFASYPVEAAATRYRLQQFVEPLSKRGIFLTIKPFLNSKQFAALYKPRSLTSTAVGLSKAGLFRIVDGFGARRADVILVQREAMIFGPPLIEWMAARLFRRPMVLDLDDATYISYTSPTYGKLGQTLKWFSKTDDLIRWSSVVTCGNRAIADYAESKGATTRIIPTVVDTDTFRPVQRMPHDALVLGWIGTHSTFPYLKTLFPILQELATTHSFKLRIIGAGEDSVNIPGVEVENLTWKLEREVEDFQSFDIGLYPIDPTLYAKDWAAGKSGFKAIQYMAVGIPFVASPVGAMAEIGEPGLTHLTAMTSDEWIAALTLLLPNREKRSVMGDAGRRHVMEHYSLMDQAEKLVQALQQAAANGEAA
ncbi:MAG TPA: glycosyltransferase family 4 protein [Pyrinomonadaceae bacterium]|nr:glycosyltransferase family 4 protein [Pyrinomonadaceae bacterium]